MKLYTFQIPSSAQAGRLLPYARRMLPEVPEYILREAFRKRDVKVNGQRAGMNAMLTPGSEVHIYAREAAVQTIDIVYQDENLLVVIKPAGVSCEPDAKGGRTITQLLHDQLAAQDAAAKEPLLCHRLDNPTEGLLLLAKTPHIQQLLQDAFRARQIHKTYVCVVKGTPHPSHATLSDYLIKDAQNAKVRVVDHEVRGAKKIITEYAVEAAGECARLRVTLHTGRTHQIRAHLASIGHPLLGDDQYGDRAFNKLHKARRLMLCAAQLQFSLDGDLAYLNERQFTCKPGF